MDKGRGGWGVGTLSSDVTLQLKKNQSDNIAQDYGVAQKPKFDNFF